ncbi:MAG: AAA family ATPase [Candidatus Moranbacteria bacterium]|nr:AAA family ATPase [Candidatus Moranbacteria bacterium]
MNIILIGFMGAGKTTLAEILNKKLKNFKHLEVDEIIRKKSSLKSINQIFKKKGEIGFRKLEIQAIKQISQNKKNQIISCGGGVVLNQINMLRLKRSGTVFYLYAPFAVIKKRLQGDDSRPLFKDINKAKALFGFRHPIYKFYSDQIINTHLGAAEKKAQKIIDKINL